MFGKKCGFRIQEIQLKVGEHKGEKVTVGEETAIEVYLEGEYKQQLNLSQSLKKALMHDLEDGESEPEEDLDGP